MGLMGNGGPAVPRRGLLGAGLLGIGVLGGVTAASGRASAAVGRRPAAENDEVVLLNGRIHTMDDADRVVRHVVIRGGRFAAVGDEMPVPGPGAAVVDLGGRTVIPGIVEAHDHVVSLANRVGYHTPIESAATIREVQEILAARRPGVPEGAFVTAMGGWHPNQFTDARRVPTRAELDAAVPDRPVMLFQQFTGPAVVNSLGKAFLEGVRSPLAGPVAVAEDGVVTAGPAATAALYHLRVRQTAEDRRRSALDAMAFSASVGVTAHLDEVLFPTPGELRPNQALSNLDHYRMYDPWLALHRERRTFVRLQTNFLHHQSDPALTELRERLRNQFPFFGDDMMMTGAIGEWAAPIGAGPVWLEAQRLVAAARWRNENSVQTLDQLRQVVEAYEAMDREFGIRDLRWMVHHIPAATPELLGRLKAIGCAVQCAAFRWVTAGPDARDVGAPFRTVLDSGIKTGIHGDGVHIAPLNPFPHIHYATTGLNSYGAQVNAGQQLTRREALRLFTRENAWFLRMEDRIGSIEPEKLADLLVLDRDVFAVPDEEVKRVRPVLTMVDGAVVHDTGALGAFRARRREMDPARDERGRWDRAT